MRVLMSLGHKDFTVITGSAFFYWYTNASAAV